MTLKRAFILALAACLWLLPASAAGDPDKEKEKKPPPKAIEIGFEERVRTETWNNITDLNSQTDDHHDHVRFRTRLWTKIPLSDNIDFYFNLNSESRKTWVPNVTFKFDEIIIENAYLDFRQILRSGWGLKVGRQNLLTLGEGFLIIEGNTWDGSRSFYFNAVDLSYTRRGSRFDFLGISNPHTDRYLPRINDQHRLLTEWDEQALGVYYTDTNAAKTRLEGYYFYKTEAHDYRSPAHPQYQPERRVQTAGGRVVRQLPRGFSLTGELARQWGGQHPDVNISAWGGYAYLKKTFAHPWKPALQFGYWGFSGDDPATPGTNEGWDPLFCRWPKWSELYIYSQLPEKGIGYWTNAGMWQAELTFTPWKPLNVRATYYHINSYYPFPGYSGMFGTGTTRGDLFQVRADFLANKSWRGHVVFEDLLPGDFYQVGNNGYFLRFELIYTFKHLFPI